MKTIEQKIIKFIYRQKLLPPKSKLLIALSGGPDSVFALRFFHKYSQLFNITLAAFHLNHNLRGEDSGEDEKFCRLLCDSLGIDFYSASKDVKLFSLESKLSIEEAARKLRYEELERICKESNSDLIVTGHNQSDNSETVIYNLIKGTGLKGLAGIPVRRGKIIRPLLVLDKDEIRSYLKKNGFESRLDKSNLENDYQRNFLRNEIIPLLKKNINPSADDAIFRNSLIIREIADYEYEEALKLADDNIEHKNNSISVSHELLSGLKHHKLGVFLQVCFEQKLGLEFNYDDYVKIIDLLETEPGSKAELTNNFLVIKNRETIDFQKNSDEIIVEPIILRIGESTKFGNYTLGIDEVSYVDKSLFGDKAAEYFSLDDTEGSFTLRKWKEGDSFVPFGSKTGKKVSTFLIDEKVDILEKKNQLLLLDRNNIVWVVGLRLDDRYKITKQTKRIGKLWMIQQ